jgi:hypothetical protein
MGVFMSNFEEVLQSKYLNFLKEIEDIKNLEYNWDTYNGKPPSDETIKLAFVILEHLYNSLEGIDLPEPQSSPGGDGSIQFDWTLHDIDLELNFISEGGIPKISYLICDGINSEDWIEGNLLGGDYYDTISNTFITYLKKYL